MTKAVTLFNQWIPKIAAWGGQLKGALSGVSGEGGRLQTVFQSVSNFITGTVIPAGQQLWTFFQTQLLPVIQRYATFVQTRVIPAIAQFVTYLASRLGPILRQIWTIFTTQVLPILAKVASFIVGKLVPAVLQIAKSVISRLKPVFEAVVATIRQHVLPAVQKLLAKFREWWPTIQRVISVVVKITGAILKFAAAILGKVLPPVIKFAGALLGKLVGAISTVIGWVIKIIGKILDFGSAVVNAVKDVGKFVSGLRQKFNEAVAFVKSIPGKIKRALGNLGSLLINAGKDIIRGLLRGIERMAGAVWRKVSGIVDGIKSRIAGALKIHSPSRVMMGYGRNIGEGLAIGMEKSQKKVSKAATALTAFPDGAGMSAAETSKKIGAYGNVTYVFNGRNVDINERTIVPLLHGAQVRARVGRPR